MAGKLLLLYYLHTLVAATAIACACACDYASAPVYRTAVLLFQLLFWGDPMRELVHDGTWLPITFSAILFTLALCSIKGMSDIFVSYVRIWRLCTIWIVSDFFFPFWLFLFYTCSFSIANILLEWYLLRFDFVYFNSLSPRQSTLFVPNAVLLLLVSFKLFFTAITVVFNEFQFYCLYLFFIFPFRIKFTGFMLLFCWCAPFIQRFFCRIHVIDTFIFQTIFYTKWCK